MPVNDFEKQVQQKMDELKFIPSETVWPAVEKEIAVRKRRRLVFVWLFFLLLLTGGAAWYLSGTGNAHKKEIANSAPGKNDNKNDSKKKDANENSTAAVQKTASSTVVRDTIKKQNTTVTTSAAIIKTGKNIIAGKKLPVVQDKQVNKAGFVLNTKHGHGKSNSVAIKGAGIIYHNPFSTHSSHIGQKEKVNQLRQEADGKAPAIVSTIPKREKDVQELAQDTSNTVLHTTVQDVLADKLAPSSATKTTADSIKQLSLADSVHSVASKKNAGKTTKKLDWGITVNAGTSSVSNSFSGLFSANQLFYSSTASSLNSSTGNTNAGSTFIPGPSSVKSGFSYAIGVFISKLLGKNAKLLAGLSYGYYSNQINVGTKIDSANRIFDQYRTGNSSTYTNRFHFVEVPVELEKQLGAKSRFSLDIGFSFSLLASSNALLYNAQNNIYTADKSAINNLQVSLLGGFSYRLFPKFLPIQIGPQFSYGLGSIYKKELYGSSHLVFGSINAKIFLHKK